MYALSGSGHVYGCLIRAVPPTPTLLALAFPHRLFFGVVLIRITDTPSTTTSLVTPNTHTDTHRHTYTHVYIYANAKTKAQARRFV